VFWCRPEHQRLISNKKLCNWYETIIKRCKKEFDLFSNKKNDLWTNFSKHLKNLSVESFFEKIEKKMELEVESPPYFDGDIFATMCRNVFKNKISLRRLLLIKNCLKKMEATKTTFAENDLEACLKIFQNAIVDNVFIEKINSKNFFEKKDETAVLHILAVFFQYYICCVLRF
jgi:hypothetical protein